MVSRLRVTSLVQRSFPRPAGHFLTKHHSQVWQNYVREWRHGCLLAKEMGLLSLLSSRCQGNLCFALGATQFTSYTRCQLRNMHRKPCTVPCCRTCFSNAATMLFFAALGTAELVVCVCARACCFNLEQEKCLPRGDWETGSSSPLSFSPSRCI